MTAQIESFELWRLEVPTGRVIGDSNCHYDSLDVAALCLKTNQGHVGWGYGETCWKGVFTKAAWYIRPMANLVELKETFERQWWHLLRGLNPFELGMVRRAHKSQFSYLDYAVRMALWDLMAQQVELPLFRLLGGKVENIRVQAYGSLLDYPLSEEEAVTLAKDFVRRGFMALKVKVGAPEVTRDLRRLHAIRESVGPGIEITADANEAWTCDQAIERIRTYEKEGIRLGYIEDPLHHDDLEGFARLDAEVGVPIVGHDYISEPRQARALLTAKGLDRIRTGADIDFILSCADLAAEFGVPLIFGNSMFEFNVHAAVALPGVDRLEFSDLAWNRLMRQPVRFENGFGLAPTRPGHGLGPASEALKEFSRPEV